MPDGTAEPVSRDQNLRHKRGLPFQLATSRIGNLTRLILTLAKYVMTILNTPSMCISRLSTEICFIETNPRLKASQVKNLHQTRGHRKIKKGYKVRYPRKRESPHHKIQPINSGFRMENEGDNAGRDGRTCPAKPKSRARTWTR